MFDGVVLASGTPEFLWDLEVEDRVEREMDAITRMLEEDPEAFWASVSASAREESGDVRSGATRWCGADVRGLSGVDKVAMLRGLAQMVARGQAHLYDIIASIVDEYEQLDEDMADAHAAAAAEVQAALMSTRRAAESDVALAWRLRDDLPAVLDALRTGATDLPRARVMVTETIHLDQSTRDQVIERVLPDASTHTTGQLQAHIRRLCIEPDPASAKERLERDRNDRSVMAELSSGCTATITAVGLAADRTAVAMDRINRIAQSLRGCDDDRTLDQLRADVFLDLLEGGDTHRQSGTLDIRVDLETLAGLEQRPAELNGFGPVVADIARQMTERFGPSWRIGVLDQTGDLVHTEVTRRRPHAATRRHVEMRDRTCVFPGCRRPAVRSDIDHRIRYVDGGETHVDQLVALCRHHHGLRHTFNWTHVRNADGSHTWSSPLGMIYTRPPPPPPPRW